MNIIVDMSPVCLLYTSILEIGFGERKVRAEILEVRDNVRADDAKTLYKLLEGQEID